MATKGTFSGPYMGPQGPVSLSERQRIAVEIVGPVDWSAERSWGYCACPGADFHNNVTARRDCRVFVEETNRGAKVYPPAVFCLHRSCASSVEAASHALRSAIGKAKVAAASTSPRSPSGFPKNVRGVGHTVRTGNFGMAEEVGGSSGVPKAEVRTVRTDGDRPLTRFAHIRAHPHVLPDVPVLPSEPSVKVVAPLQPKQAEPTPKAATKAPAGALPKASAEPPEGRVYCPVRLVWITREQWAQELQSKPLTP